MGEAPSVIEKRLWRYSHHDLKKLVSIRLQYELMLVVQAKLSFREVVAEALGSTTTSSKGKAPESFDELASILQGVGGSVFG